MGVMGMKKGDGQGEVTCFDETFDRIDGTRMTAGFPVEGVFGSRQIGLKKMSSVMSESGDEQSLAGVEFSVLALLLVLAVLLLWPSDLPPASPHLVEPVDVCDEADGELLAIFDRKFMPLLRAVLKMLNLTVDDCPSLDLDRLLTEGDDEELLLSLKISNRFVIGKFLKIFVHSLQGGLLWRSIARMEDRRDEHCGWLVSGGGESF